PFPTRRSSDLLESSGASWHDLVCRGRRFGRRLPAVKLPASLGDNPMMPEIDAHGNADQRFFGLPHRLAGFGFPPELLKGHRPPGVAGAGNVLTALQHACDASVVQFEGPWIIAQAV